MVVLEGGGMLTTGSNQYLQPDYLSPLPTTLDAKKSPLALLAQTCSQIGADTPNSKPLIPPLEKPKKPSAVSESSAVTPPSVAGHKSDKTPVSRASPAEPVRGAGGLAFKPYETNVLSKKSEDNRPPSKAGSVHNSESEEKKSNSGSRAPSRKSASPSNNNNGSTPAPGEKSSVSANECGKSVSPANGTNEGTSPIIRSGLEILQGHPKDIPLGTYKTGSALSSGISGTLGGSLSSLCTGCPPGLEPTNPAFRPPFAGGPFSHHHAAMLAAGYPSTAPGPYVSYARIKTASGGEALVPVCKDPYCTGCQYSMHSAHQQLLLSGSSAGPCPSGCTQCDHQKYNLAAAAALSGLMPPGPVPPPPLSYSHQLGRPYVCSWIAGDSYCGKRFTTSDELLQHLRTHTSLATAADSAAAAAAASSAPMSLLNHHSFLSSSAALHRAAAAAYPNPPLSPLSAARYHPYSKPGLPGSLGASPFSAFNPTALGPYYSPYSIYGQRIGAAAVHP